MNPTTADRESIRSVIEQQIIAFQQDDAHTAFAFASPDIQARFKTAVNFLHMVKVAYPAIYRPRSVLFEHLIMIQGIPAQEVILMDATGTLIHAMYLMERQATGAWKIDGCFLVTKEDPSG